MAPPELCEPRALVQSVDRAVQRYLSGLAEPAATLDLIESACERLRAAGLGERERFLVDFICHCAKLLRAGPVQGAAPRGAVPDLASVRIELAKGIWQLDACLSA
ncbi:MAG: hypothetical protein M0015_13670 [Betaproteobacteria bacterium]|nr:hypothetical protein [Betaproteobacteria bacterium]